MDTIDFIRLKYRPLHSIPRCHIWYINKKAQKTDYLKIKTIILRLHSKTFEVHGLFSSYPLFGSVRPSNAMHLLKEINLIKLNFFDL